MNHPMNRSTIVRQALSRISSSVTRTGRRSAILGALLLAASTATVLATGNTQPTITSAVLSRSVINEGENVTLSFAFTDPDVADYHALRVRWWDGQSTQQTNLPPGQTSIQLNHTYADDNESPDDQKYVRVTLYDRQTGPGGEANDNANDIGPHPYVDVPITVKNAPPAFISRTVRTSKQPMKGAGTKVVVEGDLTDPGVQDHLQVTAIWNDPASPTPTSACTMSNGTRHFVCEHAYSPGIKAESQRISLNVKDDKGAQGVYVVGVLLP